MMPIKSVMHFVITLLILNSNVPQRYDKLQLVLVTSWKEIIKILSSWSLPLQVISFIAITSSFKSKASSGHDGVFSKLVKDLKYALSFPLSLL